MLRFELPSLRSPRVPTAEPDTTRETAMRIDAADRALLVVAEGELHPAFEGMLTRLRFWQPSLDIVRVEPHTLDPPALWFGLDAVTKIRRLGLPAERMMLGFYLFEQGQLRGWHPLARFAGMWVEHLLTRS